MAEKGTPPEITQLIVDVKEGDITFYSDQEAVGRLPVDGDTLKIITQGFLGVLKMRPVPSESKVLPEWKKPTIRDIARLSGVSVATVSAIINQGRYVSPELTDRVQSVINNLSAD